jgi:hypothetical protein
VVTPGQPRTPLGFARFWSTDRSLTVLLVSLILAVFVLYPLGDVAPIAGLLLDIFFSLMLVFGVAAISRHRSAAVLAGVVSLAAFALRWADTIFPLTGLAPWDAGAALLSCGLLAVVVLAQAYRDGPITLARIQGAVAAYILIGFMFAFAYQLFYLLRPDAFNFAIHPVGESWRAMKAQLVYFSFVSLTTLGFGDVTAVNPLARSLVTVEALIGQLFPAITIARLVSMELFYRQKRGEASAREGRKQGGSEP